MRQGWFSGGSAKPADRENIGFCRVPVDGTQSDVSEGASEERSAVSEEKGGGTPPPITVLPPHPWRLRERKERMP